MAVYEWMRKFCLSSSSTFSFSPLAIQNPSLKISSFPKSLCFIQPESQKQSFVRNKRYPDGERIDFRARAISGIDLGSFESVLEAIAVLTAIIVVHESGHFLAASLQGIHVSKFAIGFGPILAKFDFKNVEYSLRAFLLGGFVGFPDNDLDSEIPIDDENLLKNRPTLDRSIVVSAGIIANVIFAYKCYLLVCLYKKRFLVCLFLKLRPFLLLPVQAAVDLIGELFLFGPL